MADVINVTVVEEALNVALVEEAYDVGVAEEAHAVTLVEEVINNALVEQTVHVLGGAEAVTVVEAPQEITVVIQELYERYMEDDVQYAKQLDVSDDETVIYVGEAVPGTATSAAAWRIKRTTILNESGDLVTEWAGGVATFTHAWDDHLTLIYS